MCKGQMGEWSEEIGKTKEVGEVGSQVMKGMEGI